MASSIITTTLCFGTSSNFVAASVPPSRWIFFFNDAATTEIYTLSLHDALPIYGPALTITGDNSVVPGTYARQTIGRFWSAEDRKSTRLNSSHLVISYAVFC